MRYVVVGIVTFLVLLAVVALLIWGVTTLFKRARRKRFIWEVKVQEHSRGTAIFLIKGNEISEPYTYIPHSSKMYEDYMIMAIDSARDECNTRNSLKRVLNW